jgi:TPR repeat protein
MKFNQLVTVLLLFLVGSAVQSPAQPTGAERKEFETLKARADKGDPEAQISLAAHYAEGTGVARDPAKSVKWLRKAADQGVARAQCLLALVYANGQGVKLDKTESVRWLRRAADQGLAEAQYDLGMCYANGDGVPRNAAEAAAWYRKAADQALPDAEAELGNCYLEGTGVPKDVPEGVKLIRKAAEEGFGPAQNALGLCYLKGTGVTKDYVQAYKWLDLASAQGDERADDAHINLASAERFLTPAQVAEAQRLAREFKPGKPSVRGESPSSATNAVPHLSGSGVVQANAADTASTPASASKTGVVNVSAADDSCEIFVDGAFVGNTPAKVKLTEGAHIVEVKRAGFKDYRKQIKITEGSELTLRAVLEKP